MPRRFCAVCGKPLDSSAPHFSLCRDCFSSENPLFHFPEAFSLKACRDCGNYSVNEKWFSSSELDLFKIVQEAITNALIKPDRSINKIQFQFHIDNDKTAYDSEGRVESLEIELRGRPVDGSLKEYSESIKVLISYDYCQNCLQLKSGIRFLSILQLRVINEDFIDSLGPIVSKIHEFVEEQFLRDPKQYITKLEDQKYGIDLFLSTNELMNHIISFLKNKEHFLLKRSKKLIGRDIQKGKNIYRLKTLLKFLPVKKNDKILFINSEYYVEQILRNKVILRDEKNKKTSVSFSNLFKKKNKLKILGDIK